MKKSGAKAPLFDFPRKKYKAFIINSTILIYFYQNY